MQIEWIGAIAVLAGIIFWIAHSHHQHRFNKSVSSAFKTTKQKAREEARRREHPFETPETEFRERSEEAATGRELLNDAKDKYTKIKTVFDSLLAIEQEIERVLRTVRERSIHQSYVQLKDLVLQYKQVAKKINDKIDQVSERLTNELNSLNLFEREKVSIHEEIDRIKKIKEENIIKLNV
jgi:hypothetical protein